MEDLCLSIETRPDPGDLAALSDGLNEHSRTVLEPLGFRPLAIFARDREGALVGGVYGFVNWTWLQISLLWVAAERRREGVGARLLEEIEGVARDRGCLQAHVDTLSFQARPFYERHGYECFATLEEYPPGYERLYLRKKLAEERDR